jgi:hypothetical protein
MKAVVAAAAASTVLFVFVARSADTEAVRQRTETPVSYAFASASMGGDHGSDAFALAVESSEASAEALTAVVRRVCSVCHNDRQMTGNLSLQHFDVALAATEAPETAEKIISKLRAGMMPPPGIPRPGGDTLQLLVETLEGLVGREASTNPNPGNRIFQRLNRAEYERSIEDLLGLKVSAGDYLPLDTKSANFDNIADVQMLSPTLLDSYLRAASEISRLAVGVSDATPTQIQYRASRWGSQLERIEGAPIGTRGGISVEHTFPADGEYTFQVSFHSETTGTLFGNGRSALNTTETPELVEISINGERAAVLEVDRWMHVETGINLKTAPIFVRAGPQRVSAAFLKVMEGPAPDLISPHDWSLASTAIAGTYGILALPHLKDMVLEGPFNPTGVSETPSRKRVFSCRPTSPAEESACVRQIVSSLANGAYRRPVTAEELQPLLSFYQQGAQEGGFEAGIRTALEAILASPHFIFRFEREPARVRSGASYRIADVELASRLSFFLWGTPPDAELLDLATRNRLGNPRTLEQQARRMLADPRSEALGTRFAAQWLQLQDLDKIQPDVRQNPDFDEQLRVSMQRETEVFFNHLVREDRSMLELYTADYTFVNERLARHYGFDGVRGNEFRRVQYPDDRRRGILGHASVLTLTSVASRTSPVLRGKWVMIALLGTPPPPPPAGVPTLEETDGAKDGRFLTTRERMEMHRASPVCRSCHLFMDPIGLALDNFDVTGKWRFRENGMPLDTRGDFYDGTPVSSLAELQAVLLKRPEPLIRTFTQNLMAYAMGRRVEWYDKSTVRAIAENAARNDNRMSSYILGVIQSDAFQMKRAAETVAAGNERQ